MPDATRGERLDEFLRRLGAAPAASNHDEAIRQVAGILNQVEDELTSIPYNPPSFMTDGRMYPLQPDSRKLVAGRPDLVRYRSRGHSIVIGDNGSILIIDGSLGPVAFTKPGADGQSIQWGSSP